MRDANALPPGGPYSSHNPLPPGNKSGLAVSAFILDLIEIKVFSASLMKFR